MMGKMCDCNVKIPSSTAVTMLHALMVLASIALPMKGCRAKSIVAFGTAKSASMTLAKRLLVIARCGGVSAPPRLQPIAGHFGLAHVAHKIGVAWIMAGVGH